MPEHIPEFQGYAAEFHDSAQKAKERLPLSAQEQLSRVLDRFVEDPDRFQNRIQEISKVDLVYKHPDPPFEITFRIDRKRRVIAFIDFTLRVVVGSLVIISYSHADDEFRQELRKFLKPLVVQGRIRVWDDTEIEAGDRWREQITEFLGSARVAIFLVSSDFIASDFIAQHELPLLQEKAKKNDVRLLWIAVRPYYREGLSLEDRQALNDPKLPLSKLKKTSREEALVKIVQKIAGAAV